jgi:hypothetical protein
MLTKRETLCGAVAAAVAATLPATAIEVATPLNPYQQASTELLLNLLKFVRHLDQPAEFVVTGGQDVLALVTLDRQGKLPPLKIFDFRHEGDKTFRIRLISAAYEGELPELWPQPEEVGHG